MEKYINLIKEQIEKLSIKDFDLEAWKSSTTVLLERIFGKESQKISEIGNIKYEQGSWTLRDASGIKSNMESYKKRGKEILIAAINELENFGLPEKDEDLVNINIIRTAIENELTVSQFKEISEIIKLEGNIDDKKIQFKKKLKSIGDDKLASIFINLINDKKVLKIFS
ncbi:MAG: hypothetical protein K9J13_12785 [Saprospiraceae bacterium]|nr:hypothetical protein [Saprospiraceae bacterium]